LSDKLTGIDELLKEYKKEIQGKKESDSFKKGSSQLEQNKQYKEFINTSQFIRQFILPLFSDLPPDRIKYFLYRF
jgi:hypothetical protein